jgi:hypothetical protein
MPPRRAPRQRNSEETVTEKTIRTVTTVSYAERDSSPSDGSGSDNDYIPEAPRKKGESASDSSDSGVEEVIKQRRKDLRRRKGPHSERFFTNRRLQAADYKAEQEEIARKEKRLYQSRKSGQPKKTVVRTPSEEREFQAKDINILINPDTQYQPDIPTTYACFIKKIPNELCNRKVIRQRDYALAQTP